MNKKSSLIIGGGIVIATIIIIGFYLNQELEVLENNEPTESKLNENIDPQFNEKLDEIEKKAGENQFSPAPRDWQISGPFEIDRTKYLLGEKVFLRIGELYSNEKGQIAFLKQSSETHYTVYQTMPFDGNIKSAFNYYTDIKLSKGLGLCSVEDIIGEWTVVFRGTGYQNLKFEVVDQILPGEEGKFNTPVC